MMMCSDKGNFYFLLSKSDILLKEILNGMVFTKKIASYLDGNFFWED